MAFSLSRWIWRASLAPSVFPPSERRHPTGAVRRSAFVEIPSLIRMESSGVAKVQGVESAAFHAKGNPPKSRGSQELGGFLSILPRLGIAARARPERQRLYEASHSLGLALPPRHDRAERERARGAGGAIVRA